MQHALQISRKIEYGTRAMLYLASLPEGMTTEVNLNALGWMRDQGYHPPEGIGEVIDAETRQVIDWAVPVLFGLDAPFTATIHLPHGVLAIREPVYQRITRRKSTSGSTLRARPIRIRSLTSMRRRPASMFATTSRLTPSFSANASAMRWIAARVEREPMIR